MIRPDSKLRVWWLPQVGVSKTFYVPVKDPEEAYKTTCMLAFYDCFLENNSIRGDYANTGGLEYFDVEENQWFNWYFDDGDKFYEDLDEYIINEHPEILEFRDKLASQVKF